MRDMQIIGAIIIFMVFQVFVFNFISADPFLQELGTTGNKTLELDVETTTFNMSTENPESVNQAGLLQFLDMTKRFFTIRINILSAFPTIIKQLIGFLNFFLLVWLGIVMWRQVKVGGGG